MSETYRTTFSTSDLSRKSGDIIAEALQGPVAITQRKKPRLVVLSIDRYEALASRSKAVRQVGTLESMPDELFEEIESAVGDYIDDDAQST